MVICGARCTISHQQSSTETKREQDNELGSHSLHSRESNGHLGCFREKKDKRQIHFGQTVSLNDSTGSFSAKGEIVSKWARIHRILMKSQLMADYY